MKGCAIDLCRRCGAEMVRMRVPGDKDSYRSECLCLEWAYQKRRLERLRGRRARPRRT